ncbi:Molybdopterin-synthase sulfurtransferase, partial [Hortaea werneckii]
GVGGLGCPAAAYLAGAGVGAIGLMDGDTVEESNLHRQVAHTTARVGMNKAESAREYLKSLNNTIQLNVYTSHLSPEYALDVFRNFDLVLDCTDHPTSRYLISDACVLVGKPLVSASALKTEGQLIVLNNPPAPPGDPAGGPCYRCVFPTPPPPESVLSCGEGGILGPVVGTMGVLQALEAVKVLTAKTAVSKDDPVRPTLLIFSAYSHPQFRSVRMRGRRVDCACCSSQASITPQSLASGSLDYVAFCGVLAPVDLLGDNHTVSATAFSHLPRDGSNTLIDVRDETQYAICALWGSINIPWPGSAAAFLENVDQRGLLPEDGRQLFTVCRFGNDSQLAAMALLNKAVNVKNITGGFEAWRKEVDPTWPDY